MLNSQSACNSPFHLPHRNNSPGWGEGNVRQVLGVLGVDTPSQEREDTSKLAPLLDLSRPTPELPMTTR